MIKVEGYKAFKGVMLITPNNPNIKPFELESDWLYKPEYECWYNSFGNSYTANICQVLEDQSI